MYSCQNQIESHFDHISIDYSHSIRRSISESYYIFKVITGIRQCGKSVLLFELFREHLLAQGVSEEQIITIELDQRKYCKFRNPITLCEHVEAIVTAGKDKQF